MTYSFPFPKELEDLLSSVSGKKIGVALSGGVDSTVVALLLKDAGANVRGYVMEHLEQTETVDNAKDIAKQLNIKLKTIDLRTQFKNEVITYFIKEYENGRTPNPCVICNMKIKFGILQDKVLEENELYATGHYLRKVKVDDKWTIGRAVDINKDQSYALSMLSQNQIKNSTFLLGYITKDIFMKIAGDNGIEIKQRKESVDLCFTDDRIRFLKNTTKTKRGVIKDKHNNVLGYHNGVQFFAVGQRRRLNITNNNTPHYVNNLNSKDNVITVGNFNDLYKKEFNVSMVNWLLPFNDDKKDVKVIVRNKMEPQKCKIVRCKGDNVKVIMESPIWAPAPGQLAVFYDNDIILGGGWIV